MLQSGTCDAFASLSSSSSRSKWNTKGKRDAAAPPIWLRRVLNDATNVDNGSLVSFDSHLSSERHDSSERQQIDHRPACDDSRDGLPFQLQPSQGVISEDASELYLNPLAFGSNESHSQHFRQAPIAPSTLHEGGSYASMHAAVSGSRNVQSARRTRVIEPSIPALFTLQHRTIGNALYRFRFSLHSRQRARRLLIVNSVPELQYYQHPSHSLLLPSIPALRHELVPKFYTQQTLLLRTCHLCVMSWRRLEKLICII
jgi:hypothetical protein